jgi:beta-lactamase class A
MIIHHVRGAGNWLRQHHKRVLGIGLGSVLLLLTIIQLRYPADLLLPFTTVDGINVSSWSKAAAILKLDSDYRATPISIYLGSSKTAYQTIKPVDIGVSVKNDARINSLDYPWYLRLVPASLFWGHFVLQPQATTYTYDSSVADDYIQSVFGETCHVDPQNATIKVTNNQLEVVKGLPGGTCQTADVTTLLGSVKLSLTSPVKVTIPAVVIPAAVDDGSAKTLATQIEAGVAKGINVTVGTDTVLIPRDTLVSWLDFSEANEKLDYSFNSDRATKYLTDQFAAKVAKSAGVTTIHTYNFSETSRETGVSGQTLDVAGTLDRLKSFIAGKLTNVTPAVALTAPSVKYVRSYSDDYQGLAALMQNFATTHTGTYGVVLNELSGEYRRASYNADMSFTTASTYKLFVAYSTLRRIEDGSWHWTDQINGGRDLAKCFDDMIVVSDNACGSTLLSKIGYTTITNEAHAIGCIHTSFLGSDGIKTTPADLALLLGLLQTGQILTQQSSRDTLINAMKRNVYRQGIPAGETATVADKVGFLDALLHDASIVYASNGPYILVIMTNGSSWANIAELTRELEALRLQ